MGKKNIITPSTDIVILEKSIRKDKIELARVSKIIDRLKSNIKSKSMILDMTIKSTLSICTKAKIPDKILECELDRKRHLINNIENEKKKKVEDEINNLLNKSLDRSNDQITQEPTRVIIPIMTDKTPIFKHSINSIIRELAYRTYISKSNLLQNSKK